MPKIVLVFIPWVLFVVLYPHVQLGALVAFFAVLILLTQALRDKCLLTWGGLYLFLMLGVFSFVPYPLVIVNLMIAIVCLLSLLLKKPVTLYYARQMTPPMVWKSPLFLHINQMITSLWMVIFLASALFNSPWVTFGAIGLALVVAKWFPGCYQIFLRRRQNLKNPFLQGNFAPMHEEYEAHHLNIEGILPLRFPNGSYFRNGPNPFFEPLSYVYPFDGDGMVHGLYFKDRQVDYKNRYVKTLSLEVEQRAGKALYGGIKMPLPIDKHFFLPGENDTPFKNGAFIHVVPYSGQLLALLEANPAYVLDEQLNTQGLFYAGKSTPPNINAHVKIDPDTHRMYAISYDLKPPYLVVHQFDAKGQLIDSVAVQKPKPTMIHDMMITKSFIIVFDCPLVFDVEAAMAGESVLQWQAQHPTIIRLFQKNNLHAPAISIPLDPFFVFHFANAYESKGCILIDYIRYDYLKIINEQMNIPGMTLHRMQIDIKSHQVTDVAMHSPKMEFPTINLNYLSKPYQFVYAIHQKHQHVGPVRFDSIVKFDVNDVSCSMHDFGSDTEIGEAIFVPAMDSIDEDDGFLLVYGYSVSQNQSHAYILDAKDLSKGVLCKIIMPSRVPFGLHGSWVPEHFFQSLRM